VRDKAKAPPQATKCFVFRRSHRPETHLRDGGFGPLISERLLGRFSGRSRTVIHRVGCVCRKRSFLEQQINADYSPNCVEAEFYSGLR
jgi:hypothetical protein